MPQSTNGAPQPPRCPICDKPLPTAATERKFAPFCSQRCQQVDLFRWMEGKYSIVEDLDTDDERRSPDHEE